MIERMWMDISEALVEKQLPSDEDCIEEQVIAHLYDWA